MGGEGNLTMLVPLYGPHPSSMCQGDANCVVTIFRVGPLRAWKDQRVLGHLSKFHRLRTGRTQFRCVHSAGELDCFCKLFDYSSLK